MIVDDDEQLIALVKIKLEKTNRYNVVSTTKGSEVVEMAIVERPDLILLDIEMPDMQGGDVAAALAQCQETKDIPVLFMSSLITKDVAGETGSIIGGQHMISKSTSSKHLINKIDSMLQ